MTILKKNQVVIIVIALMLITAGYLNYTYSPESVIQTASRTNENFGDATLVNSNNVVTDDNENTQSQQSQSVSSSITSTEGSNTSSDTNNYFVTAKMERDNMYSQQLENYKNINENTNSTSEQKKIATEEIKKLNNEKSKIMVVENLIKMKGFENVIVLMNEKSVNVVVKTEKLENQSVSQIQNIISREMEAEIENIHIMNKK